MELGEVVRLKSGGPKMTVNALYNVNERQIALCKWFFDGYLQDGEFLVSALVVDTSNDNIPL
jgi:uncharacterized protein YodC (DUF2158 family)